MNCEKKFIQTMAIKLLNKKIIIIIISISFIITIIYTERPQLMCDYPLNLSILIRGGKETKWDSLSSGERNGISPARRIAGLNAC